jgi:CheY-like chemotaxis protein
VLNVTIQAGSTIDDIIRGEIQFASIQIYSPHSTRLMLSYEVEISDLEFSLKIAYQRSPTEIRKASLHGESDNLDELFETSTVLNPVIFIVDDSPVTQKTLSRMLRKINPSLTIRCFNDGSEVVEFYTSVDHTLSRPCTLILMDMQMPILDGAKATVQIRAYESHSRLREIPIVAITAQNDLNESELFKSGISGFCFKPFSEASVREVLVTHNLMQHSIMPPRLEPVLYEDEDTNDSCFCRLC